MIFNFSFKTSTLLVSLRRIQKYQKRQRKYSMFNKMIMPAEYRSEAQTRSDTERKIWRFYIFQIVFRTCVDFGFLSVQYNVYPYRFGFQKLFLLTTILLTRRVSGFEILNNATLIFQKWLVSMIFANICHYLNFPEEY